MKRKPQIIIGIILIVIFVLLAVAAPLLAPNDPNATDLALKNAPPSAEYPLGCDQMGRCELSRLIYIQEQITIVRIFKGCLDLLKMERLPLSV